MSLNLTILLEHFGCIPNFHDSKLVDVVFNIQRNQIDLTYNSFVYSNEIDAAGHLEKKRECLVKFNFSQIVIFRIEDIAQSNFVSEIKFEKFGDSEKFIQNAAYGASIEIICAEIEVCIVSAT